MTQLRSARDVGSAPVLGHVLPTTFEPAGEVRRVEQRHDRYARSKAASAVFEDAPRLSAEVPAAIASAQDGAVQTMAAPRRLERQARVQLWASPDATVRIYNASVLEDGKPKLIWKGLASEAQPGAFASQPLGPASPSERASWMRQVRRAEEARIPGQTLVTAELPADADWTVHDSLFVTQQVGARDESEPQGFGFQHYWKTTDPVRREPYFMAEGLERTDAHFEAKAFTVPPGAKVTVLRDGVPTDTAVTARADGSFALDLPANWGEATWELAIATPGGQTVAPLNGSTAASSGAVLDGWMGDFRRGLMQPPRNGRISFGMEHLPPGLEVRIFNAAKGGDPSVLVADERGKLAVKLDGVHAGDRLVLETDPIRQLGDLEIRSKSLSLTYRVPTQKEAAAVEKLDKSLAGYGEADIHFALALFGPFGSVDPRLVSGKNKKALRAALDAAKLGHWVANNEPSWVEPIKKHLETHATPSVVAGFLGGATYRGETRPNESTRESLGFTRVHEGRYERVGTRIKPDNNARAPNWSLPPVPLLANRPIDIETVRSPDTYQFAFPGAPPFTLEAGAIRPRGDIDRNIIVMTIGFRMAP